MGHKGKDGANKSGGEAALAAGLSALRLTTTTTSFNPKEAADPFELLDMCVAALQDRRGPTRELAMAALSGALEGLPPLDELDSRCLTVFALCGVSIKKASVAGAGANAREARLAYRAVGLLALSLRAGAPSLLAESFPLLARTVQAQQASHDDAPTLAAALDCLAAVTFAGALDADDAERSLKAIWAAWTFFLTTVAAVADPPRKADRAAWAAAVASLAGLLEHDDRAVRMAAGEALAVCVELNRTQHAPRRDMDALAAKVSELASEPPGKGVNNTMLPEQKDLFRKIAAFLDHGERLMESMPTSLQGCVALKVSTWTKLVQLNFLRRFLGNGFEKHVQTNELFKEAFSYGADEGKVLYIANKKRSSKTEKDLKAVRRNTWDWKILCNYPYRARDHPQTLLQIGWQALN